jgi:hypothetical protein
MKLFTPTNQFDAFVENSGNAQNGGVITVTGVLTDIVSLTLSGIVVPAYIMVGFYCTGLKGATLGTTDLEVFQTNGGSSVDLGGRDFISGGTVHFFERFVSQPAGTTWRASGMQLHHCGLGTSVTYVLRGISNGSNFTINGADASLYAYLLG